MRSPHVAHIGDARPGPVPARDPAVDLSRAAAGPLAWLFGVVVVVSLGANDGGYFPLSWAWTALVTWWVVAVAFVARRRLPLGRYDVTLAVAALAFTGWFAVSAAWSRSASSTLDETVRYLAYAGLVWAALLVVTRRTVTSLLGGVCVGIALLELYALATRLMPDRFGTFDSVTASYRLSAPISYWNGLGILAVVGLVLALGFALRAETTLTRMLAGGALPLLAAAMYFTFSRGAWLGLGVALVVVAAADKRRLELVASGLLLAVPTALAVAFAARSDGLTVRGASFEQATHDGHRLLPLLLVLAVLSAGLAAVASAEDWIRLTQRYRRILKAAAAAAVAGLVGTGLVWAGPPWQLVDRAWDSAHAPPTRVEGQVGNRLLTLAPNGRYSLWTTARLDWQERPLTGLGGGTFWQSWSASPRQTFLAKDAHGAYFETLAELGLIGLVLLLAVVAVPCVAGVRARGQPLVPFALAAYAAWVMHSGVDWDWELLGVTGPALLCGVALVAAARGRSVRARRAVTLGGAVAAGCLALAAATNVIAQERLVSASVKLGEGRVSSALADARTARRFAPWSVEALRLEAEGLESAGRPGAALEVYLRAVTRDPESWPVWFDLALAARGSERERAMRMVRRLNTIPPSLPPGDD
jgi:hypothetical protein